MLSPTPVYQHVSIQGKLIQNKSTSMSRLCTIACPLLHKDTIVLSLELPEADQYLTSANAVD